MMGPCKSDKVAPFYNFSIDTMYQWIIYEGLIDCSVSSVRTCAATLCRRARWSLFIDPSDDPER